MVDQERGKKNINRVLNYIMEIESFDECFRLLHLYSTYKLVAIDSAKA